MPEKENVQPWQAGPSHAGPSAGPFAGDLDDIEVNLPPLDGIGLAEYLQVCNEWLQESCDDFWEVPAPAPAPAETGPAGACCKDHPLQTDNPLLASLLEEEGQDDNVGPTSTAGVSSTSSDPAVVARPSVRQLWPDLVALLEGCNLSRPAKGAPANASDVAGPSNNKMKANPPSSEARQESSTNQAGPNLSSVPTASTAASWYSRRVTCYMYDNPNQVLLESYLECPEPAAVTTTIAACDTPSLPLGSIDYYSHRLIGAMCSDANYVIAISLTIVVKVDRRDGLLEKGGGAFKYVGRLVSKPVTQEVHMHTNRSTSMIDTCHVVEKQDGHPGGVQRTLGLIYTT